MTQDTEATGGTTEGAAQGGTAADATGGAGSTNTATGAATSGGGTPAAKTYTTAEVESFVRQAHAARDGAWNKHLADPAKGKEALQKLAAIHGVTLTEVEKQNVADAAASGDDSELTPREKAMLARVEKLEGVQKSAEETTQERQANEAMQADISHAARSIPYGRDPELSTLVETLILGDMVDPRTPKGTSAQKIALGIQSGLEAVFAGWAKKNGYIKDPNIAANQPLRGGATITAIGPNAEPKNYEDMEAQTAALIRTMRARK